jgi:hypothetical protein
MVPVHTDAQSSSLSHDRSLGASDGASTQVPLSIEPSLAASDPEAPSGAARVEPSVPVAASVFGRQHTAPPGLRSKSQSWTPSGAATRPRVPHPGGSRQIPPAAMQSCPSGCAASPSLASVGAAPSGPAPSLPASARTFPLASGCGGELADEPHATRAREIPDTITAPSVILVRRPLATQKISAREQPGPLPLLADPCSPNDWVRLSPCQR